MEDTAKAYIESISKHCYQEMTFYQFNKNTLKVSDKYGMLVTFPKMLMLRNNNFRSFLCGLP